MTWTLPPTVTSPPTVPFDQGTRALFGYDILFDAGMLQVSSGGDYIRVGGEDNLRAAIYRRLITRPGEFRFRPTYGAGVQSFVKKVQTQANLDACRQRIEDQLSQDRRIHSVLIDVVPFSVNGTSALKVFVKITANGATRTFEPFSFQGEV